MALLLSVVEIVSAVLKCIETALDIAKDHRK